MPIKVLGSDGNPFDQNSVEVVAGRKLRATVLLQLSGAYPTGGDALDLTNGGGTPAAPTTIPSAQVRGVEAIDIMPRSTLTTGQLAVGGTYLILAPNANTPLKPADLANLKLKVLNAGGGELGAGAYAAAQLTDVILAEIIYLR
jgi:hypothetical protein